MSHSQRYVHTKPLFKDLKFLKLFETISLQFSLFVHKTMYTYPIDSSFQFILCNADTRRPHYFSIHDLRLPLCRTSRAHLRIVVRGVNYWNQLPEYFKSITTRNVLKYKIKRKLLLTIDIIWDTSKLLAQSGYVFCVSSFTSHRVSMALIVHPPVRLFDFFLS